MKGQNAILSWTGESRAWREFACSSFLQFQQARQSQSPTPQHHQVQRWRVSMNAEKISRPFSALPLHDTSASSPTPFSPSNRCETPFPSTLAIRPEKIPCRIISILALLRAFHKTRSAQTKKQYLSLWNSLLGSSSKPPKEPPKKTDGSRQGPHCFLCTHWPGAGCSLNLYPKQCDGTMTGNFFEEDEYSFSVPFSPTTRTNKQHRCVTTSEPHCSPLLPSSPPNALQTPTPCQQSLLGLAVIASSHIDQPTEPINLTTINRNLHAESKCQQRLTPM